jgi:hypothetical protein
MRRCALEHDNGEVPWYSFPYILFQAAQHTLAGIELMRMFKKRQRAGLKGEALSAAEQFYALASSSRRQS